MRAAPAELQDSLPRLNTGPGLDQELDHLAHVAALELLNCLVPSFLVEERHLSINHSIISQSEVGIAGVSQSEDSTRLVVDRDKPGNV